MKLGYARVSTEDQNLDIQRGRLSQAGCEMMFEEKISGTARGRPELERLMAHLRKEGLSGFPCAAGRLIIRPPWL